MKPWRWLIAAALLLPATAGCRAEPQAGGGPIVVALANSPTNLDPGIGIDEASQ